MVQIRPYRASDAQAVSEIIRTTMRISNVPDYSLEKLQPAIDYYTPEKVEQINQDRTCRVAEEDGRLVGTAGLEGDELVTFFVRPEMQGRGVGAALLAALEEVARARGTERLTVGASLTGAAFYERHGYRRTGAVLDGPAGPRIPMGKRIL